jgi:cytochrome c biogenesis protein CcmG, thiol:disulfide interchange protein DsbE
MSRWLIALTIILCSCTSGPSIGSSTSSGPGMRAVNATQAPLLPTTVAALPSFDTADYDTLLSQLRGTPIVVNIWGSWCGPCRSEAPDLARAARIYGDRVQFVGVDILDTRGGAADFIDEFGWTYPSVYDPSGSIRDELGFAGQPVTLFYDRDGAIRESWQGPVDPHRLDAGIRQILA